jgi:hypothetical protein
VIFASEKLPQRFRQLRNISGFFSRSCQSNLATSKKFPALAETFLAQRFTPKQLFGFTKTFPVFSPEPFRCLRNFSGDFLSDSMSSIQQIDDP